MLVAWLRHNDAPILGMAPAAIVPTTLPPSPPLQAQLPCFWYLGAPASCAAGASVQLYPSRDVAAATVWRLAPVG